MQPLYGSGPQYLTVGRFADRTWKNHMKCYTQPPKFLYNSCSKSKGKGTVHPRTGHEGTEEEWRYRCTLSLTSALIEADGQRQAPAALPRERPGTHCLGGWVDSRAGLDGCGKSRPPPGYAHTVQPLANRYTD